MPRIGITIDDVMLAADQIYSNGNNPTIEKVRQIVGAGSNTTISKYLNNWKEKTFSQKSINNLKPATSDLVKLAAEKVWQQIREEADTEIQIIKTETQKIVENHEKEKEIAENQLQIINDEKEKLQHECCELHAKVEIQKIDYKKLKEEFNLLQERCKGLDSRYIDLQKLTNKHQEDISIIHKNEINHLIEKSKSNEIIYQKLIDELKLKMEEQRHQYVVRIDSLQTEVQKLNKKIEEQNEVNLLKSKIISELNAKIDLTNKERDMTLEQLNKQEVKWNLLEKNNSLTERVFLEIKNNFKLDLIYFDIYQNLQTNLNNHIEKLNKSTNEAAEALKYFLKEKETLNGND